MSNRNKRGPQGNRFRPLIEELERRLAPSAATTSFHIHPDAQGSSPSGFTPLQILEGYGFYSTSGVNNISFNGAAGNGAGQTIAIVDAYNDPNIAGDLAAFDGAFGLPAPPSLSVVNQNGLTTSLPGADRSGGWEMEEALDVEWAHAIAPGASIVLVEANSASINALDTAVATASRISGVSVVSMSWSGSESSNEKTQDSLFTTPGVTYLAATGDSGSPSGYPAYSPNVVAVGGTSLFLNANNSYQSETAWSDGGGGISLYESEPAYQDSVQSTGFRTVPDVSFDADPNTGVAIYDSYANPTGPWTQIGGTSLSTPSWAGIIAIINQGRVATGGTTLSGASQTLPGLYSLPSTDFTDITSGNNGTYSAAPGYDLVTGIGTPVANNLIPDMVAYDNPLTVTSAPTQLVLTVAPASSEAAGAPFSVTVAAEDANGNIVTTFTGSVTVSLSQNPGGSTLGGTLTVNAVAGQATFSNLTLNKLGTGYVLQFASTGLPNITTSPFNVTIAASKLVVTTQPPTSVAAGASYSFIATVEDNVGNVATGYSGSVTVSIYTGPAGGVLSGTLSVPVVNGQAHFTGLSLNVVGSYSLLVSSTGLASATTSKLTVTAGTATHLAISTQPPASVSAGSSFTVVVASEDAYGNVATGYSGKLTIALSSNPGGAALGGTLTVSAVNGLATFSNLTLSKTGTGYVLKAATATTSTLGTALTHSFNVAAAASRLVVTTEPPSTIAAGTAFIVNVSVEDASGDVITGYTGTVTIAIAGDPAGGSVTVQVVNGVADFDLVLNYTGSYTLVATSHGLTSATTTPITVTSSAFASRR